MQRRRPASPSLALALALPLAAAMLTPAAAIAQRVVRARVVLETNAPYPGGDENVTAVYDPQVTADGQVLILAVLASGEHVLWLDDAVLWSSAMETTLSLSVDGVSDDSYGVASNGDFFYAPNAGSGNVLYGPAGVFLAPGDDAPAMSGTVVALRRPFVRPNGERVWIQDVDVDANGSADVSALIASSDGTIANARIVFAGLTIVDGRTLDALIDSDFDVSNDGSHVIGGVDLDTGSTLNDAAIFLDGQVLFQEWTPIAEGAAENWDNFDLRAINSAGDFVFAGDTDGAAGIDEFIAANGVIAIREGDVIDGTTINTTAQVQALDLDDHGRVVHQWARVGATEVLFVADDVADLAGTSRLVLEEGDGLDLDGDGVADAVVLDFLPSSANGPGVRLGDRDGMVYIRVALDYNDDGGADADAVVGIDAAVCGDGYAGGFEACDGDDQGVGGESATCNADCTVATCGDGLLNTTAGEICDESGETANCNADCTLSACGDSLINTTAGEACDDGGESRTCNADCTVATCGDDQINLSADEICDDGGESATCDADCTPAACGDGALNASAGETCDGGGETSACDVDCTPAACGDGVFNASAGETCDDGNTVDGDGCSSICEIESNGSGCGCRIGATRQGGPTSGGGLWLLALVGLGFVTRRRLRVRLRLRGDR